MGCECSAEFVKGKNGEGFEHYHVELTESMLNGFEVLNSMCLLNNFDHLMFFLECQMGPSSCELVVPPFDVFIVLMTLVTVSDHYKDESLRANDPYNVSRLSLSQRSLKVLQFYVKKLNEFDVEKYGRYQLELLRCQLFIAYDSISPGSDKFYRKKKLRRTGSGRLFDNDFPTVEFKEPYKSYISCLDQKQEVLGNTLLNLKLNQPGEFKNMILWTLSNSMQSQQVLYLASHNVWMPLLDLLLDILTLRYDYFVKNEAERDDDNKYVQQLSSCPLALFLRVFESIQFSSVFCECVFSNCDYELDDTLTALKIHPVYHGETTLSNTFHPRVKYTDSYKIRKSLALRRKLLGVCFELLTEVPNGHRLIYPRMIPEDISSRIAVILVNFKNLEQFKAFFSNNMDKRPSYVLAYIVDDTLLEMFKKFGRKPLKKSEIGILADSHDVDTLFKNCKYYIESGLFAPWDSKNPEKSYLDIQKADTCLIVSMKCYAKNGDAVNISNKKEFLKALLENDKKRKSGLPLLYPLMTKLIDD
ncbi:hypothetical protein ZYGR_0N05650 [Zygosaccharomyces rouxii]|uniref:ZYRO0D13244p n=2 Tax=Zygosaccharomyces rouxii TaxID=4956 RepID=C5DWA7_ZYGRC|nr:uncharacterized protein ZYRO0D13244g [Zygosaccharomyces rouxii]KAH9200984.1 DNA repair protein Nse5/Nse6 [Zygosaccharomyces rouxii]GAV49159.1 hypothetical protein ZYGR_0N05650 [Zygosaccharomyces rouxii]CAR28076.1 ZYRO0D13244p [Zygosaccharomyces rouxii]